MQYLTIITFLPIVCCVWRHCCARFIPLFLILVLTAWGGLGTYLIVMSNLSHCEHDSLWVMALVELLFIFTCVTIYFIIQIYSACSCESSGCGRCGRSCKKMCAVFAVFNCCQENANYTILSEDEDVSWIRQNNIDAFLDA